MVYVSGKIWYGEQSRFQCIEALRNTVSLDTTKALLARVSTAKMDRFATSKLESTLLVPPVDALCHTMAGILNAEIVSRIRSSSVSPNNFMGLVPLLRRISVFLTLLGMLSLHHRRHWRMLVNFHYEPFGSEVLTILTCCTHH